MTSTRGNIGAALPRAIRLLGRLWLHELVPEDVDPIRGLPELGPELDEAIRARGGDTDAALVDLAVEHHRLFGIEMPPYESVFVDPSGMLGAPASERVAARLERAGWQQPPGVRVAAPDHIGLELLALGDLVESGADEAADGLVRDHLALWAPPMVLALEGLGAHGVYWALGDLTLEVVLGRLAAADIGTLAEGERESGRAASDGGAAVGSEKARGEEREASGGTVERRDVRVNRDPFPELPPAPKYRGSEVEGETNQGGGGRGSASDIDGNLDGDGGSNINGDRNSTSDGDRDGASDSSSTDRRRARRLTIAREAGLYLSRQRIKDAARAAGLPVPSGAGERSGVLLDLFRTARAYDAEAALAEELCSVFVEMGERYTAVAARVPAWQRYADAWGERLNRSMAMLREGG